MVENIVSTRCPEIRVSFFISVRKVAGIRDVKVAPRYPKTITVAIASANQEE